MTKFMVVNQFPKGSVLCWQILPDRVKLKMVQEIYIFIIKHILQQKGDIGLQMI